MAKGGSLVGLYSVDQMTDSELKQYIEALKDETERTKEAFRKQQEDKQELSELRLKTEANTLNQCKRLIQKDLELQKLLFQAQNDLRIKDNKLLIADLKDISTTDSINRFLEINNIERAQKEEKKPWKKKLEDSERKVEYTDFQHRIISMDLEEGNRDQLSYNGKSNNPVSGSNDEYSEKYKKLIRDFYTEKKRKMSMAWQTESAVSNPNPSTDPAETLSQYFQDVSWKNMKATKDLKERVSKLQTELDKVNAQLNKVSESVDEAQLENDNPQNEADDGDADEFVPDGSSEGNGEQMDKVKSLDELTFENDVLTERLRQVTAERNDLESTFISTVRKIYLKAEFSSFICEQIIRSLNKQPNDEEESKDQAEINRVSDVLEIARNDFPSSNMKIPEPEDEVTNQVAKGFEIADKIDSSSIKKSSESKDEAEINQVAESLELGSPE